jgi:hypothetical protein
MRIPASLTHSLAALITLMIITVAQNASSEPLVCARISNKKVGGAGRLRIESALQGKCKKGTSALIDSIDIAKSSGRTGAAGVPGPQGIKGATGESGANGLNSGVGDYSLNGVTTQLNVTALNGFFLLHGESPAGGVGTLEGVGTLIPRDCGTRRFVVKLRDPLPSGTTYFFKIDGTSDPQPISCNIGEGESECSSTVYKEFSRGLLLKISSETNSLSPRTQIPAKFSLLCGAVTN